MHPGDHHPSFQARVVCLTESKAELLSLQQIRCFRAAVELGSFSAAAEALRVSQPAVAEQVRKLEQILGTNLFVRAARGVFPTEAGRAFAEHATRGLQTLEDAAASVGEFTSMQSGSVALGTFSAPSAWRLEALVDVVPRAPPRHDRPAGRPQLLDHRRPRAPRRARGGGRAPADRRREARRPPDRARRGALRHRRARAHAAPGHDRAARVDAAGLLRRRVGRPRPDPPAAGRARAGARPAAAPARRGRADRSRPAPRRARPRRHLPAERLHARALLPRRADHGAVQPRRSTTPSRSSPAPPHACRPAVRELLADLETHMRAVAEEFDRSR